MKKLSIIMAIAVLTLSVIWVERDAETAILVLTSKETATDGQQYIDDVVGVFPDGHQFSSTELEAFNFLTINGSEEDVEERLNQLAPQIAEAYLWASDNKYHWTEPGGGEPIQPIDVFQVEGSKRWYKLENDFSGLQFNVGELTAEEKLALYIGDINHPSVDSFIRKLIKDITILPGNDVEIKDLRNTSP